MSRRRAGRSSRRCTGGLFEIRHSDGAPRLWRRLWEQLAPQIDAVPRGVANLGVQSDDGTIGNLRTFLEVLRRCRDSSNSTPRPVTVVEDDVEVCADFVSFVAQHWKDAGCHVTQWFAPGDLEPSREQSYVRGWVRLHGSCYLYNQATTFSPQVCDAILTSPRVADFMRRGLHGADGLAGAVLGDLGLFYAVRVPGGAQHLGADTLVLSEPEPAASRPAPARRPRLETLRRSRRKDGRTVKAFHIVVERKLGKYAKEIREPVDVDDLMKTLRMFLRELADGLRGCDGSTVTLHPRAEACDHEH